MYIQTGEYFANAQAETIQNLQYTGLDSNIENLKAIAYSMMVVEKNGKYGILDFSYNEIIGAKYNSILFDEYDRRFIISNEEDKYGIIDKDGNILVSLKYDEITILNYSPLLYKVKKDDKYGIMTENGNLLTSIEYDNIGYPKNSARNINYTLIIPNLNENIQESIVVCIDSKYGLIDLETGETFIECSLDGIYSVTDLNEETKEFENYYIVENNGVRVYLTTYVDKLNEIKVNM